MKEIKSGWDNLEIDSSNLITVEDEEFETPNDVEETQGEEEGEDEEVIIVDDLDESDNTITTSDKQEKEEVGQKEVPKKKGISEKISKTEPEEKEESGIDTQENNQVLTAFAKDLKNWEFLPDINEEDLHNIKTPEDLGEVLNKQLHIINENWQREFLNSIDSKTDGLLTFVLDGGNPKEFLGASLDVTNYSEEDIVKSEELQKRIIKEYYKEKGFPERRIQKAIDESIDLEEDALEFYEELVNIEKETKENLKKRVEERKQRELEEVQRRNEVIKNNVLEVKEFIPGRRINTNVKENIFENIPNTLNKINSNLEKYAPILAYLDYYKLLEGDFSKVMTEAKTRAVSNLSKVLSSRNTGNIKNTRLSDEDLDLYEAAKFSVLKNKKNKKKYF